MFEPNINIVVNSNKEMFIFKLSNDDEIIYDIYDSSLRLLNSNNLSDKNILRYSVAIDHEDTLHLVVLMGTGELNYYKCIDKEWSKRTIAKFDLKSNIYNQIEILLIKNKLHIIYNYSHLINSNIWTIQHVVYDKESNERHNAIRYISKRIPDPFAIDVDSQGTIHLIYRTYINNSSQIHHVFYSPYTKAWSSLSKQLSSENMNNIFPFLFIDSQDNLHGLWIEEIKDNLDMKYLRMSSSGKEKYIWKEISLPYIPISMYPPIIFEENNRLKLLYLSNNIIQSLYSSNYGSTWIKGEINNLQSENISMVKIKSNISTLNNKINHGYCSISNGFKFYYLDLYPHEEPIEVHNEEPIEINAENSFESYLESKLDILNYLYIKLEEILDNQISLDRTLSELLNNQIIIENKLDSVQKSINSNRKSFFERFFS